MKYYLVALAVLAVAAASGMGTASAASITKTQSGLVSSDSLTTGNLDSWTFGGTAALRDYYEDSQGLHLGIQSPGGDQWVNYYASAKHPNAYLFHSTITINDSIVPDGVSNVGLYVEGSDFVPHVGCEAYADWSGHYWVVEQSSDAGNTYDILYITPTSGRPLTQDCTIITNGDNYLKVYIGGDLVFSSTTMDLGMSAPLIAYFQDDTSSPSSMHYATYRDYYATTDEKILITNNPSNAATVKVVSSSGQTLASSPVTSGNAILNVGKYNFPLSGTINVYDSSNSIIASSPASIYGGDVFSVTGSSTVPQVPTGLTATPASSSQINLVWSAPSDNGGSPVAGYKIERSANGGATWSVITTNTGSTSTTYSDTGLAANTAYTYRVSAINSVGTGSPSSTASATTQTAGVPSIVLNNIQTTSGTVSSPSQITLSNFNVGAGNDRLLVVGVTASNNGVGSVVFGGVQLTRAVSSFNNNDAEFWYLKNPAGTANIVVTMDGPTSAVVGAYSFFGVDQTNPIPTSATNHNTAPGSPTISLTTAYQNSWVIDLPSIHGGVTLGAPTCTQQWDVNMPSVITGASSSTIKSSAGPVTCSWIASRGDFWDNVAIEVHASGSISPIAPQPPTGLSATAVLSSQINLSWSAPSDNEGSPVTGYKIERSVGGGAFSVLVANTGSTATTHSDTGLTHSTLYSYRVSAINSVGIGSPSNTASATTSNVAPFPPTGLTATPASSSQINLVWSAPSDNGGSPVTGYKIERSANGGATWSVITTNTGSTSTTYSDTGLAANTAYTYRVSAINSVGIGSPSNTASATTPQPSQFITLVSSGLVEFDPLNNETQTRQQLEAEQGFWHYGGSAFTYFNPPAPTDLFKDSQGLHVGTSPPVNGTYAGYYAVTGPVDAKLFHAVITTPVRTISGDFFQNGLYVQTFDGRINYVTCVSITSTAGTSWHVVRTFGNTEQATQFEVLWSDPTANQPLTRDCTLITNGNDYLKVYLDGVKIYQNNTIDLQMPGPFLYFLEPQNSHSEMLYGIYHDYYAARGEAIQVTGLPAAASRVDVISVSGGVLATAPASNGVAALDVGMYHFPIPANIKVYDSNNSVITSTQSTVEVFGGDVYTVR
jgi:hypothetical protein